MPQIEENPEDFHPWQMFGFDEFYEGVSQDGLHQCIWDEQLRAEEELKAIENGLVDLYLETMNQLDSLVLHNNLQINAAQEAPETEFSITPSLLT